jgi:large subunit ribosomal protein L9
MATKLLLIQDVEDLGRSGDVVSVKPGFARNYLIPRGFAHVADRRTLRMQVRLQEQRAVRAAEDRKEAEQQADQLKEITLTTIVKVDPEGHMYGSVSVHDIVKLLADEAKVELEKKAVQLKAPIKQLGIYKVTLRLKEDVETFVTVKVQTEDGRIEPPKTREQEATEAAAAAAAAAESKPEATEE